MKNTITITLTQDIINSFKFTGCGWVDDGYNGSLADSIIESITTKGSVCTMFKKGRNPGTSWIAWELPNGDEFTDAILNDSIIGKEYTFNYDSDDGHSTLLA